MGSKIIELTQQQNSGGQK